MAQATAHSNHQLISSEDVEGTEVYDAGGKNISEVDHLMIDKVSGLPWIGGGILDDPRIVLQDARRAETRLRVRRKKSLERAGKKRGS